MGRSASHIALECYLQTRCNAVIVGEQVKRDNVSLKQICTEIADMICARSKLGKNYGVVLVPEGLVEFMPEMDFLISEINEIFGHNEGQIAEGAVREFVQSKLTAQARAVFDFLPLSIADQLLLDRDPHGNVQVAKIDTERLLILMLETELEARAEKGEYRGKFFPQAHYFGYEGRCGMPTNYDAQYCYSIGLTAGVLMSLGCSGFMSVVKNT